MDYKGIGTYVGCTTGQYGYRKRHSQGTMMYNNKYTNSNSTYRNKYIGNWKDDKRHGLGKMIINYSSNDETHYYGNWKDDKRDGSGNMVNVNGDEYKGIWENDQMTIGTMKYSGIDNRLRRPVSWGIDNILVIGVIIKDTE